MFKICCQPWCHELRPLLQHLSQKHSVAHRVAVRPHAYLHVWTLNLCHLSETCRTGGRDHVQGTLVDTQQHMLVL